MKNLNNYIIEKLVINKNIKSNKDYKKYGKGEFTKLDIDILVKKYCNYNKLAPEQKIVFYNALLEFDLDKDIEFYHICNQDGKEKILQDVSNFDDKLGDKGIIIPRFSNHSEIRFYNFNRDSKNLILLTFISSKKDSFNKKQLEFFIYIK